MNFETYQKYNDLHGREPCPRDRVHEEQARPDGQLNGLLDNEGHQQDAARL